MNNLDLEETHNTPSIICNAKEGRIMINGRSIPENPIEFYTPIYNWVKQYTLEPEAITVFDVKLEYFNIISSKCIHDLFKLLEKVTDKGKEVLINWYFEEDDEEMQEAGEDYDAIIKLPFKMISVKTARI